MVAHNRLSEIIYQFSRKSCIIAASNRDLKLMAVDAPFRQYPYHGLNVAPLLQERKEYISLLARFFMGQICKNRIVLLLRGGGRYYGNRIQACLWQRRSIAIGTKTAPQLFPESSAKHLFAEC